MLSRLGMTNYSLHCQLTVQPRAVQGRPTYIVECIPGLDAVWAIIMCKHMDNKGHDTGAHFWSALDKVSRHAVMTGHDERTVRCHRTLGRLTECKPGLGAVVQPRGGRGMHPARRVGTCPAR